MVQWVDYWIVLVVLGYIIENLNCYEPKRPRNEFKRKFYDKLFFEVETDDICVLLLDESGPLGCSGFSGVKEIGSGIEMVNELSVDILNERASRDLMYIFDESIDFPGAKYPNKKYGLYPDSNYTWNCDGRDLLSEYIPFPIVRIPVADRNRASAWISQRKPQAQVEYKMKAQNAQNSSDCIESETCAPLGSQSVYSRSSDSSSKPIIVFASQLDSTALFHNRAYGATSNTAGVVVEALIAEAFSKLKDLDYNLLFVYFNGEQYGYSGSFRFLNDLMNFSCRKKSKHGCDIPFFNNLNFTQIDPSRIQYVFEFGQLGSSPNIYQHFDSSRTNIEDPWFQDSIGEIKNSSAHELPPASLQSFHRMLMHNFTGIVFTDFDLKNSNKFFQTERDNDVPYVISLCHNTQALAKSILKLASNNTQSEIKIDCQKMKRMLHCLGSNNEEIVKNFCAEFQLKDQTPISKYVGVFNFYDQITPLAQFIFGFMSELYHDQTSYHHSVSPAFYFNDDKWRWEIDPSAPSYFPRIVESYWEPLSSRWFEEETFKHRMLTIITSIGILVLCGSVLLCQSIGFKIKSKDDLKNYQEANESEEELLSESNDLIHEEHDLDDL